MIRGFHCIFTAYGFWLPNEPRGSWSSFVASWELLKYGPATKVDARRSIAGRPYDKDLKRQMQADLRRAPISFTGEQAQRIVRGFAQTPYTLHACVVLPEHVHLVVAYHPRNIRRVVAHLKAEATQTLRERGWFMDGTPWAARGWNVYLNSEEDVLRAIRYVEQNPLREGKRIQCWSCVVPYPGIASQATRLNI